MRLKRIHLTNYGRHKDLDVTLKGPVIGLMGANGTGKSTVMRAVRQAFTGLTDDNAETYVRNFGAPDGASNAINLVEFLKHGQDGSIERQVGKTAKRTLKWNGEVYTSAAKVNTAMAEIFSADRYAIDSAIFIQQAELDKLLFGEQTDREQLMARLLLLSHLEKIEGIVDDRIGILRHDIQDLSSVMDDLKLRMKESAEMLSEINKIPLIDFKPAITQLREFIGHKNQLTRYEADMQQTSATLRDQKAAYSAHLSSKGIAGASDLDSVIMGIEGEVMGMTQQRGILQTKMHLRDLVTRKEADIAETKKQLASLDEQLANRTVFGHSVDELVAMHENEVFREQLNKKIADSKEEMIKLSTSMPSLQADQEAAQARLHETAPDFEELLRKSESLRSKATVIESWLKHAHGSAAEVCPICDRSMEGVNVTPDKLEELKRQVLESQQAYEKLRTQRNTDQTNLHWLQKQYADAGKKIGELVQLIAGLESKLTGLQPSCGRTPEALVAELNAARNEQNRLISVNSKIEQLKLTLQHHEAKHFNEEEVLEAMKVMPTDMANLDDKIKAETIRLDATRGLRTQTQAAAAELTKLEGKLSQIKTDHDKTRILYEDIEGKLLTLTTSRLQGRDPVIALHELEAAEKETDERRGRIEEIKRLINSQNEQMVQLKNREQLDERKRGVIRDLEQLKQAFKRKGMPLAYIQECFNVLVQVTRQNLSSMDSNFTVDCDESESVSFKFMRTDDSSGYWMPQSKLSGGQRVRLTIAFLMAVQQLVLPEVGLLVLDEPSVHLDDQGIESLRDLLISMSANLQNTESQIIVCDHNPALLPAFSSVINLT